jgi:polyribonucleotide nucleotidyltransferase
MAKTIEAPREDYKPHAPRIVIIEIEKEFIGAIIGPGGKSNSRNAKSDRCSTISIEEIGEYRNELRFASPDKASIDKAVKESVRIVAVPEVGETYDR